VKFIFKSRRFLPAPTLILYLLRLLHRRSAASTTAGIGSQKVWSNGYAGVYHFQNNFKNAASSTNTGANNGTTAANGRFSSARNFASAGSQFVSIPYNATLGLNTYTMEAWTNNTSIGTYNGIFGTRVGGDQTFDAKWQSNVLHGDIGNGASWLTTNADYSYSPTMGVWYHVAYEVQPNNYQIF